MPKPERYWEDAVAKLQREGLCRVCGSQFFLQMAHTSGRKYDRQVELEDGSVITYVDPLDIVILCEACHKAYDEHRLSILEHLHPSEQARVVERIGILRALHRLTGQRDYATPIA